MKTQLPNPYERFDAHRSEVRVGHGVSWVLTFVFLILCVSPPFWRNMNEFFQGPNGWTPVIELFRYAPDQGSLSEHLRQTEKRIEDAGFTAAPRRTLQGVMTTVLKEGNRKTAIGSDGWLYFRPAIDAVTGYGPLKPEPDTVAKDPNREPWQGPLDAIVKFNQQLEGYGVELILMPIPVKPMIYPEGLTGRTSDGPVTHRDAEEFYGRLRSAGVEVFDVSDEWFAGKNEGTQIFLKQDTHWTPETMQATAGRVATYLKERPWFDGMEVDLDRFAAGEPVEVSAPGDLVENLELPGELGGFVQERARITPIKDQGGEEMSVFDQESPIVMLGDSFTNIFHQEGMKWGTHAGFAEHLSKELGMPLDTIAQNGQASTGVRRTLAVRPNAEKMMREKKKAVLWAIAARDLFLSETVARDNQVKWEDVAFSSGDPGKDIRWPVTVDATVTAVSAYSDPKTAPYEESLYSLEYHIDEVKEGEYLADTAMVYHWAFRNRERTRNGNFRAGEKHRLTLVPIDEIEDLKGVNRSDDFNRFDLIPAWAESVTILSGEREMDEGEEADESAARIASIATVIFCLLFGGTILCIYRKKRAIRTAASG